MKMKILIIALSLGWVFLALFLTSGYFFNKLSNNSNAFKLSPITWDNHLQLMNGAIECSLIGDELLERKKVLQKTIFSQVQKKEKSLNGYTYYFVYDTKLLAAVLEHVQIEKACCPFFKFDISILAFNNGFALKISGSEEALEMLKEFESSEF